MPRTASITTLAPSLRSSPARALSGRGGGGGVMSLLGGGEGGPVFGARRSLSVRATRSGQAEDEGPASSLGT